MNWEWFWWPKCEPKASRPPAPAPQIKEWELAFEWGGFRYVVNRAGFEASLASRLGIGLSTRDALAQTKADFAARELSMREATELIAREGL